MKVAKFGGSSLANGQQVQKVVNIIKADKNRQAIVVSAPGKRFEQDNKITDLLITYANQTIKKNPTNEIINKITNRYKEISEYFKLPQATIENIHNQLLNLPHLSYPNKEYLKSTFKAYGEKLNAQLLAAILNNQGIKAKYLDPLHAGIRVTSNPNDASILSETYTNLKKFIPTNARLVIPGFFGITKEGHIATFSRGGSDITGALVAKGLHATLYENFTDVNAIYSVNPNIISKPQPIRVMTYREMRELSYAGFSVFHDEAILPAIEAHVPIIIKNTNHPNLTGTLIVSKENFKPSNIITGVSSSKHFSALYLHRYLLNKEIGFTLKLLKILYKYHISYEHMPSGIDDLTIIFDDNHLNQATIEKLCKEIKNNLKPDQLEWINDYAIIMVVGEGMRYDLSTIEKIVRPLTEHNIDINMINQGASQISIMLGTKRKNADKAVKLIYQHFFENNSLSK